jgi:hypothetical protein
MSIGRSKEEQQLTTFLAKTLVEKEVIEPMKKIGWGHGNPPPPDYTTTRGDGQPGTEGAPGQAAAPAPAADASGQPGARPAAAPAPNDQPKADSPKIDLVALFESLRDPETGLIGKKYRTVEEAIKGSGHLANMAKQSFTENAALRAATAPAPATPAASPAAAPQPKPVDSPSRARADQAQARLDAVLSSITENGGVLDAETQKTLSAAQRELADAVADYRVQETLASSRKAEDTERDEWRKVDEYMAGKHPAAARFSEEVALHIQSDPLLSSAINALLAQGNKVAATELAWTSFEKVHGEQVEAATRAKAEDREADLAAREQVRKEQLEKARKDAGVIQGSAGGAGVHERAAGVGSREEIDAAKEAMRREGDAPGSPAAARWRALVIGPSLDPTFFGGR